MNFKRFLSVILCVTLLLTVAINFVSCNVEVEENEDDVTEFELSKFLYPIWTGDTSYAEAAFVREAEEGGIAPIELLYPIDEIISVRSADLKTVYVKGVDYDVDDQGRLIVLESGSIPCLAYDDYFFPMTAEEHAQNKLATKFPAFGKPGYGYIRAEIGANKPGMSAWTLAVTYKHSAESVVKEPESKSYVYDKLITKIFNGEEIKIVATGDSITDGWSASGSNGVNIAPYCPQYNVLVEQYIKTYGATVTQKNVGVSGSNTDGGVSKIDEICAENPDLVIIAFGMNDGCSRPVASYVNNINVMVDRIKTSCPDAAVVVVGTCLPNDKISWGINDSKSLLVYHKAYAPALEAEEKNWTNAAFANVTQANIEMFERKVYENVAGSNSNHPNDYMHRVYAQVIIQTIFGDYLPY
jgi:lysophospholipase L1-like esterase